MHRQEHEALEPAVEPGRFQGLATLMGLIWGPFAVFGLLLAARERAEPLHTDTKIAVKIPTCQACKRAIRVLGYDLDQRILVISAHQSFVERIKSS